MLSAPGLLSGRRDSLVDVPILQLLEVVLQLRGLLVAFVNAAADVDQILGEELRWSHRRWHRGRGTGHQPMHGAKDRIALLKSAVDPRQVGLQASLDCCFALFHLGGVLVELSSQHCEAAVH